MRIYQYSRPKTFKNSVLIRTTTATPHAYTEWARLMSRSGLSDGSAAITGLISTSARPAAAEKITVPKTIKRYARLGKSGGNAANRTSPVTVKRGIIRTVFVMLNLCE